MTRHPKTVIVVLTVFCQTLLLIYVAKCST